MTSRSNFMFTNLFNNDLNYNKSIFKSVYNSIEFTGKHISMVVNSLNKLGNSVTKVRSDMYKLVERASNSTFFHNTVMVGINNDNVDNLVNKDNIYYLLLSGVPKQEIENIYQPITAKELLNQLDMYIQAHRNNIVMGLDEVLKRTTGNFSFVLYEAPTNSVYFFTSNKSLYLHYDDNSIYIYSDKPEYTDLQVSSSSLIDNRTIYSLNSRSKYVFKQYIIDDPIAINVKYDLTMNYDHSIESFILPYIVNYCYNPNRICINIPDMRNDDEYVRMSSIFNKFIVEKLPLSKGELLFNLAANLPINYIDSITDLISIEMAEKIVSIQNGSRYIPVFKNLQDYEILLLGIYLNVPFNKYDSKCNHTTRNKFGNYTLCGECEECKELYKKFAQLGYTEENMPVKFAKYTELDKIKITNVMNNALLDEEAYLMLRNKLIEVFPNDAH